MVVTRRNANAEPAQITALERSVEIAIPPAELPAATRPKRGRRAAAASVQVESQSQTRSTTELSNTSRERAAPSTPVTTSTATVITTSRVNTNAPASAITTTVTKRRTRSTKAETASPLRALPQQPERVTQKRKRTTKKTASETPEPEPQRSQPPRPQPTQDENSDDQEGIFFSKSEPKISSIFQYKRNSVESENELLREEYFKLQARVDYLEIENVRLTNDNDSLRYKLSTGQVFANHYYPDFDAYSAMEPNTPSAAQPEFVQGSESALALLHKVEEAAKQSANVVASPSPSKQDRKEQALSDVHQESPATSRPISTPSGFFSRSFSALKSTFGFSSSTPQQPPPSPTPSRAPPPPNTMTEVLSVPPTPIGERVRKPAKKKKRSQIFKTLTKGVQHEEISKAEKWAREVMAELKNDSSSGEKRKRLEQPVLYKDLKYYPSSKPWEAGFGDPLGDMDLEDDDVVPTWAVYAELKAEEEEHRAKKQKAFHGIAADDDDIVSLNDTFLASTNTSSTRNLIDTNGCSTSLLDFHPRRSTEPSPMFKTPISHQQGGNVFDELRGHEVAAQIYTDDLESLQRATKTAIHEPAQKPVHNPDQGSFSVPDYDSDDDDTTVNSEISTVDAEPLWTQPPPPAPVPAHAPLPGVVAEAPLSPTASQPFDEVERQRQRLMKHTPAKPSRLREATYPSPSLMSDAGNESIMLATPVQAINLFADMPGAEPLGLDDDVLAAAEAYAASDEFQQQLAAIHWSNPVLTYDSDEEDVSSE